ncbi:putative Ubiquitin-like domain superfamily [Helianthus annuus]|uniref:Putative autophagy-related protein 11, Ubiquitin-related domain protein n=1 Tax=Helianthus annuus TaxID=4232 RepID=A0A251SZ88_HELAN|nr:autophagy-related protein 11 [Helianthus annuus]XP_021996825.1 autophagy-related protein 11 [Helianthus annuus]XP_021996826.1 autophagy-related protein 11 [Helianthus annuus]KAF5776530.1 putative Ubiquitin-like domain superfamily [Helianthus annuus]
MSSSGNVIQRGKLLVHIAENGHSFELDCDEYTVVESIQQYLESVSAIRLTDQLLLYLDMKLESQNPLSAYKLPSDDGEIFLFNKSKMRSNSTPPEPEEVQLSENNNYPDPRRPSSSSHDPHPLDEAPDPALKALPSYERQFRYHYQLGDAIYRRTVAKYEACNRLAREQRVQEKALEIARGNLDHFYKMIHQNYTDFVKCYSQQQRTHSNLLVNFGRDLERLRSIKLIPVLQTAERRCLLDFVKEDNLQKMVDDCGNSHRQFESKVGEFKQEFGELKRSTEHLFSSKASILSRDLERAVKEHEHHIDEQKSILQALSKDVGLVKKLVDDCLTSQLSNSLRPHDAVSALGPMYEGHDKSYIPKMQACERAISNLLTFCKNKKTEMNTFVHKYMQKIAYIQYTIKDVRYKFSLFTEALKRQNDQFEHLKVVRGIGPAYRACLAEIVRRKASMKLYMGMAGQLAERLATKRESEIRRREEFLKVNSLFIPRDILASMGLYDTPNTCDVNVAPFDTNLLDIDISDLDRFAPEHLVGLSFKKSLSSMSQDVEVSSESGTENDNDFVDASELVEIAGTSKLEVENAKLKAELASTIAILCSFSPETEFEDSEVGNALKNSAEKTAEALRLKDEHEKHLVNVLKVKHMQCEAYEKRIKELENRLSDQYSLDQKLNKDPLSEPMDEASYASSSLLLKSGGIDSSGTMNANLDSSMVEPNRDEKDEKDAMVLATSSTADYMPPSTKSLTSDDQVKASDLVAELQNLLTEKSNQLNETETKLRAAMEEVTRLGDELEISRNLLEESQMNCAHLENCLHEAREEAQTHLCAADRRASEYSTLRASAIKIRSLFERLKTCVSSSGVASFADSLRVLAQALANSANDGDDGINEFRECVRVLAEKVGVLTRQRAELIDRYTKTEASHEQLTKELEEKKDLVNALYMKLQSEKQVNKEKITFGRLELHEIAAFVLNEAGHYEAINRNCTHYYLSSESVALFTDHLPHQPTHIVGQIVHIERQTVKSSPVPYGLPVGCEYFVVTVAMIPDTAIHSPTAAS